MQRVEHERCGQQAQASIAEAEAEVLRAQGEQSEEGPLPLEVPLVGPAGESPSGHLVLC